MMVVLKLMGVLGQSEVFVQRAEVGVAELASQLHAASMAESLSPGQGKMASCLSKC